jgi:hypothetical protein
MRIVHIHLPRTAGTALRAAFVHSQSRSLRVCPAWNEEQYAGLNLSEYEIFSGHISFAFAQKLGGDLITILRDPVDRFLSLYHYWRELHNKDQNRRNHISSLASQHKLEDFVELHNEPGVIVEFCNRATWQLAYSATYPMRKMLQREQNLDDMKVLELAKGNLLQFKIVGFQEQYHCLIEKINSTYGLNIKNRTMNVTKERVYPETISAELKSKIYRWVYLDNELYNYALARYGPASGEHIEGSKS